MVLLPAAHLERPSWIYHLSDEKDFLHSGSWSSPQVHPETLVLKKGRHWRAPMNAGLVTFLLVSVSLINSWGCFLFRSVPVFLEWHGPWRNVRINVQFNAELRVWSSSWQGREGLDCLSCLLLNMYTAGEVEAACTPLCREHNKMVLCQAGRHIYYICLLLQAADERNPLISLGFNPGLRQIC